MELKLEHEELQFYTMVMDTGISREETVDIIVPDACPDISEIVDCCGSPYLQAVVCTQGKINFSGTVNAVIFYTPEGCSVPCKLDVSVPYQCDLDHEILTEDSKVVAQPSVKLCEAKMINSRKVLIRTEVYIGVRVLCADKWKYCIGIQSQDEASLQVRFKNYSINYITKFTEKEFIYEDELPIPAGRKKISELMFVSACPFNNEARVVGNKLVLKGSVRLETVCMCEDDSLMPVDVEFPISQILDSGEAGENSTAQINICVAALKCKLSDDGRDSVLISAEIKVSAVIWEEKRIAVVSDAYSTGCNISQNYETHNQMRIREAGNRRQQFRSVLETEGGVSEIITGTVGLVPVGMENIDGRMQMCVLLTVNASYRTENGEISSIVRTFHVMADTGTVERNTVILSAVVTEKQLVASVGGLELRCNLEFQFISLESQSIEYVSGLTATEFERNQEVKIPSVVLRKLRPGEEIWDLGKEYYATVEEILSVNQITEGNQAEDRLLLIPHNR